MELRFRSAGEELKWLDGHVRRHTVARFGPVRETDRIDTLRAMVRD